MIPTMSGRPRIITYVRLRNRDRGDIRYDGEEHFQARVEKQSKSGETLGVFGDWTKREYTKRQLGRWYDL